MITGAEYYSNYHIGYRRPRRTSFFKISFWIVSLGILFFVILALLNILLPTQSKSINIITPLAGDFNLETLGAVIERRDDAFLSLIVEDNLKDKKGSYAVGILNLTTGDEYFKNKHQKFDTASLYKLWVMSFAYQRIENASLKEDAVLSESIENLNKKFNIASESAERKEGEIKLSVGSAVSQMISRSDNYSALLLSSYLGLSNVQNYLNQNSLNDSNVGKKDTNPTTSAYDTLQFLYKLYYGELANEEFSEKMITILKAQVLNEKLPKYLPKNVQIAHKTGELGTFSHDAGIVYSENGPYIIVILSDTNNKKTADETIAQISKEVYEYFSGQ